MNLKKQNKLLSLLNQIPTQYELLIWKKTLKPKEKRFVETAEEMMLLEAIDELIEVEELLMERECSDEPD